MADTYHPQQQFAVPKPGVTATSGVVAPIAIVTQGLKIGLIPGFEIDLTSTFVPLNQDIVVQMELYAPGSLTTWPDNLKPQYRIPAYAITPNRQTLEAQFDMPGTGAASFVSGAKISSVLDAPGNSSCAWQALVPEVIEGEFLAIGSSTATFAGETHAVLETIFEMLGSSTAAFFASAFIGSILDAPGSSSAVFESGGTGESTFLMVGSGSFQAWADTPDDGDMVLNAPGSSACSFVGSNKRVARCADAFTYDPLAGPAWDGRLRRDPEIMVKRASNDSPSSTSFTDEVEPALGENVQLDLGDGQGTYAGGVVQSYTTNYDGRIDRLSHDTVVADYLWLLNKRRPFGCYDNVSATTVALDLMAKFAPPDFDTSGITAGLPAISVSFDGSLDFSGCFSVIASRIFGHFKVDENKKMWLFQNDPTPGPDPIDDNNTDLLRDQPFSINRDMSQLRNRVFVRGAAANLLEGSAVGATQLVVDGLDIFDPNGGYGIIGCDVFSYGSAEKTLLYPIPESSLQVPGTLIRTDLSLSQLGNRVSGPIKTNVRYSCSFVFQGNREGPRNPALGAGFPAASLTVGASIGFSIGTFTDNAFGNCPAGPHVYAFAAFDETGGAYYSQWAFATTQPVTGSKTLRVSFGSMPGNDFRPTSVTCYRRATLNGVEDYYTVVNVPWDGTGTLEFLDNKDNASLGNPRPRVNNQPFGPMYDTWGDRVFFATQTIPVGPTAVGAGNCIARKVYREEAYGDPVHPTWTTPELILTVNNNDPYTDVYEDTRATSAIRWEDTEIPTEDQPAPPEIKPQTRYILRNVSGLDEAHVEGDNVNIWIQRDDLESQVAIAEIEGGDGLHEFYISDTALRSNAQLAARGDAELEIFAWPIVTAKYSTWDPKSVPGGEVDFNLSWPPFVDNLKITEVTVDKVHFSHGHRARYNVTASSVKFTLQDLLRRTVLRPY